MRFLSTRGKAAPLTFSEAARQGLAPDGGLYVPERFPQIKIDEFAALEGDFAAFAARMLTPFFEGDPLEGDLGAICAAAFDFPIPLKMLERDAAVLELFHGPTCAFKDIGARFLAECATRVWSGSGAGAPPHAATVIVATSGDTGGAVAGAFHGKAGMQAMILYPKGKISARQEKQLTCWGDNVRAFAVRGSFDDCQRVVKEALRDPVWSARMGFMSANSISVGRLLPQMVFHARAAVQYRLARGRAPNLIVPTGNLGDATAALWAKRMGFPIARLVLATNANATIRDFFASGEYRARASVSTLANAMDVGDPSNMERLRALYPTMEELKEDVSVELVSDEEISRTIRNGETRWGEAFCPHTATGIVALERALKRTLERDGPAGGQDAGWIVAATAHPAKFETIVEPLLGHEVLVPPTLQALLNRPSVSVEIEPTLEALKSAATPSAGS